MATSRIADSVGRVLGDRYRLTRPLGVGASAHVYVAEDVNLRRLVAIKLLHPALASDASFLRRFRAESQVVASLRHPNILTVFDWGEDGGTPYLVMELLEGGSLRSLLDRGSLLSPAQAAEVGADAARALDYAHRRGLVHRDIKPANLIFDDEGRVRVADFGLARALAEATWTEPAGAVVGTARYAAPEQARGEKLDGRSDVYALAVVLVEATSGRVPFAADTTLGTLMARLERPLAVPDQAGPLREILEAAGQVDPAGRPDAGALTAALERAKIQTGPARPLPLAPPVERQEIERDHLDPTEFPGRPRLFDRAEYEVEHPASGPEVVEPPPEVVRSQAPRLRRRLAWLLAVLLVLGAAGLGAAYATGQFAPYHLVPPLKGDTEQSAVALLQPLHLHLVVSGRSYQNGTTAGAVLSQSPAPGTKLQEGHTVRVVLSLGPQPVAVPAGLDDQLQGFAEGQLQQLGLKWKVVPQPSLTVAAGSVISISPVAGTMLLPGQIVTLTVSNGKPFVAIPAVVNTSFAAEQRVLQAKGFTAVEKDVYSNTTPKGQVVGISPAAGSNARVGSVITVQVSKGPQYVPIPNLTGDSVGAASQILAGDGFAIQGVSGNPLNTVSGTIPRAGTMAIYGSSVEIITR